MSGSSPDRSTSFSLTLISLGYSAVVGVTTLIKVTTSVARVPDSKVWLKPFSRILCMCKHNFTCTKRWNILFFSYNAFTRTYWEINSVVPHPPMKRDTHELPYNLVWFIKCVLKCKYLLLHYLWAEVPVWRKIGSFFIATSPKIRFYFPEILLKDSVLFVLFWIGLEDVQVFSFDR